MVASVEARRRLRERGRATDPWWGSPRPPSGGFPPVVRGVWCDDRSVTGRRMRMVLTCWGAAAALALIMGLTRAGAWGSVGPEWTLTFLATYLAGLWAIRAEPGNRAAVRLISSGCRCAAAQGLRRTRCDS